MRVDQIGGLICPPALIAGIAILVFSPASRACTANVPVRQRHFTAFAVSLLDRFFNNRTSLVERFENSFAKCLVLRRVGRVVIVELDQKALKVSDVFFMNLLVVTKTLIIPAARFCSLNFSPALEAYTAIASFNCSIDSIGVPNILETTIDCLAGGLCSSS